MILIDQSSVTPRFGFHIGLNKYNNGHRLTIFKYHKQYGCVMEFDSFRTAVPASVCGNQSVKISTRLFEMTEDEIIEHVVLETI